MLHSSAKVKKSFPLSTTLGNAYLTKLPFGAQDKPASALEESYTVTPLRIHHCVI